MPPCTYPGKGKRTNDENKRAKALLLPLLLLLLLSSSCAKPFRPLPSTPMARTAPTGDRRLSPSHGHRQLHRKKHKNTTINTCRSVTQVFALRTGLTTQVLETAGPRTHQQIHVRGQAGLARKRQDGTHVECPHNRRLDLAVADGLPLVYSLQFVLDERPVRGEG